MTKPTVSSAQAMLANIKASGILSESSLETASEMGGQAKSAKQLAIELVRQNVLTSWQSIRFLNGARTLQIGNYILLEQLGYHSLGSIFLASHSQLARKVTLCTLAKSHAQDPKLVEKFLERARRAAAIDHPHIQPIHDVNEDQGRYFVTFSHLEGKTLKDLSQEHDRFNAEIAAACIQQAAKALSSVHQHQQTHDAIHPGNLILDREGRLSLLYLGVEPRPEKDASPGSLPFSPEALGLTQPVSKPQADMLALGCTFFYLLTGMSPIAPSTKHLDHEHVSGALKSLPSPLSEPLTNLCQRMLSLQPSQQFQSCKDLETAFAHWSRENNITATDNLFGELFTTSESNSTESEGRHRTLQTGTSREKDSGDQAHPLPNLVIEDQPSQRSARPAAQENRATKNKRAKTRSWKEIALGTGLCLFGGALPLGLAIYLISREQAATEQTQIALDPPHNQGAGLRSDPLTESRPSPEEQATTEEWPVDAVRDAADPHTDNPSGTTASESGLSAATPVSKEEEPDPGADESLDTEAPAEAPALTPAPAPAPTTTAPTPDETEPISATPADPPADMPEQPTGPTGSETEPDTDSNSEPSVRLEGFPTTVRLPGIDGDDADANPVILGKVHLGDKGLCFLHLRGGDQAASQGLEFRIRELPTRSPTRDWQIQATGGELAEKFLEIADLSLRDGQLSLQWSPAAKQIESAFQLANCLLSIATGDEKKVVQLRPTEVIDPITLALDRSSRPLRLNLDFPPPAELLKFEITAIEGPIPADKTPALPDPQPLKNGNAILKFGDRPESQGLEIQIEWRLKRQLQINTTPFVRVVGQKNRTKLNPVLLPQTQKKITEYAKEQSLVIQQLTQQEVFLKTSKLNGKLSSNNRQKLLRIEQTIEIRKQELNGVQAAEQELNKLAKMIREMEGEAQIHFRVFHEVGNQQIILLTTKQIGSEVP